MWERWRKYISNGHHSSGFGSQQDVRIATSFPTTCLCYSAGHAWKGSSTKVRCSVTCRQRRGCGRVIRYGQSGPVNEVLNQLSRRFDTMYAASRRPSIPPEKLMRALLLQMLYSIRSQRLLIEESMLFRWFVGLNLDEEGWNTTTFTQIRDRLEADVAKEFLAQVVARAETKGLTSA